MRKDLDRIEISISEFTNLLEWRDSHKDLVRNYKQVIPEGLVVVTGGLTIYFKFLDDLFTYYETYNDETLLLKMRTQRVEGQYLVEEVWVDTKFIENMSRFDPTFSKMDMIQDTVTTVVSSMAYITYFSEEVQIVNKLTKLSKSQRKRVEWHNRNDPDRSNVIKLNKTVYKILDGTKYGEPRHTVRHAESWSVRGHQRKLPNGKIIWVKPYTKGTGVKKSKTYKL